MRGRSALVAFLRFTSTPISTITYIFSRGLMPRIFSEFSSVTFVA